MSLSVHHPLHRLASPRDRSRLPYLALVDDFLSREECQALIERIDSLAPRLAPITTLSGFVMRPDLRNNERAMFDDLELAARLWTRLEGVPPREWQDDDRGGLRTLESCGLNERFRGYRYRPGQRFGPHCDGAYWRSDDEGSMLTLLLYLNDGFTGGTTTFLDHDFAYQPRTGQALLFYHPILHEGQRVESGVKYVLRSDVMYRVKARPECSSGPEQEAPVTR